MLASSWFISPKKVKLGLMLIEDLLLFSRSVVSDSSQPHGLQHTRFYVLHHLPALAPTHVHWVSNAIQPSHPLSSPSPPTFNLSQHQGLFKWVSSLHRVAKVLELQHHSFQWIFRLISFKIDWFYLCAVQGTLKSLLQTTVQKHQFFNVQLSLWSNSHIHTWQVEKPELWLDGLLSAFVVLLIISCLKTYTFCLKV